VGNRLFFRGSLGGTRRVYPTNRPEDFADLSSEKIPCFCNKIMTTKCRKNGRRAKQGHVAPLGSIYAYVPRKSEVTAGPQTERRGSLAQVAGLG